MKIYHTLCLGAAISLTQFALAELPIPNNELGRTESLLDFCSKAKPESAEKYKERGKALVGKASEEELAKARDSGEYKDAYSLTKTALGKASKEDATKFCTALLESK